MTSLFEDMRRAGYEIGPSKAELARVMERALLQIEPGTPDLKDAVFARMGSTAKMAKVRDLQAAWQTLKRRAARKHPELFLLEGKTLRWNSSGPDSGAYATAYQTLHRIYDKHRRRHPRNPDSKPMCCMWSTSNPPDSIEGSQPLLDIEEAFGISIDEDEAMDLYDMMVDEAARKIAAMTHRSKSNAKA